MCKIARAGSGDMSNCGIVLPLTHKCCGAFRRSVFKSMGRDVVDHMSQCMRYEIKGSRVLNLQLNSS